MNAGTIIGLLIAIGVAVKDSIDNDSNCKS